MNYILRDEKALLYESGFGCDNGLFISIDGEKYLLSDSRYTIDAKLNLNKDVKYIESPDLFKDACKLIKEGSKLLVDPKDLSVFEFEKLKLCGALFEFREDFSKNKRIIKSKEELEYIRRSAKLNVEAFNDFAVFLSKNGLGLSEEDLYNEAKYIWGKKGDLSFLPIIAINENAAKAHARASDKRLKYGDSLLVDAGTTYKGYCSDRTRVIGFNEGELSFEKPYFAREKVGKMYDLVKLAHDEAIKAIKVGMDCKDIDSRAREVFKEANMDKYFTHSLGHGVGLNIHELPVIAQKSTQIVEANMAFTIEPGLYFEGDFGLRFEDIVIIHENGEVEVL